MGADTHLFAVLVCDDGAFGRARVCAEHDAVLEGAPYDGGAGAGRLGHGETLFREKVVAVPGVNSASGASRARSPYRV